ncbi:hypothetical protein [Cohnella nanjingensis]|uniref:Uncharacterized protein n=1 Tax=Cohnella nanjingensis TaxID=1387779 RepID=A0A7X0VFV1_9BACL|nr:hypothetical protein [Cohnella nanjingensis]MBB6671663.1 hypothetical protein [Cohnella nanjingensis]
MSEFDRLFEAYVEEQKRSAAGQRLEMLGRDLTGTKKMLEVALLPALKSFNGLVLEYEMMSLSGMRIYVDAFYMPLGLAFDSDGYVSHGENLTRDRFSFERMRVRSIGVQGYRYFPFSYDELDKKPEACRRSVYELLGRFGSAPGAALMSLPVYERELLRFGWMRGGNPFTLAEACTCLQLRDDTTRKILKAMTGKEILLPLGVGGQRTHSYKLTDKADLYLY